MPRVIIRAPFIRKGEHIGGIWNAERNFGRRRRGERARGDVRLITGGESDSHPFCCRNGKERVARGSVLRHISRENRRFLECLKFFRDTRNVPYATYRSVRR